MVVVCTFVITLVSVLVSSTALVVVVKLVSKSVEAVTTIVLVGVMPSFRSVLSRVTEEKITSVDLKRTLVVFGTARGKR